MPLSASAIFKIEIRSSCDPLVGINACTEQNRRNTHDELIFAVGFREFLVIVLIKAVLQDRLGGVQVCK